MIFNTPSLTLPLSLKADLCVIGSGAGGSMVANIAAKAGMKVIVLEAGPFVTPSDMTEREEEMLPKLFWESGARTTADRAVHIHQGRGIGGSTLHNLNLCKRIPDPIIDHWIESRKLDHLGHQDWDKLYREVEKMLEVSDVPENMINKHNRILEDACKKLGWEGGFMKHNRTGCVGSGFCELGCSFDAKNNACKILVPEAVKAGAEFFSHCQASRILFEKGRVTGVEAYAVDPVNYEPVGKVEIKADRICLSASATGTAAIILRSKLPHPKGTVGQTLRIHPAIVVAGEFSQPIRAWEGIPQSYECTEFLDFEGAALEERSGQSSMKDKAKRLWIIPAFAHPMGTSTMLPGHGEEHQKIMSRYSHMAVLTAMLHDSTKGIVSPKGELGLSIDYWPNTADRKELHFGLKACSKLLLAAGAKRVIAPGNPVIELKEQKDLQKIDAFKIEKHAIDIIAVHPMGTVPMGDDPQNSAVDSTGRYLHTEGLWIADGSLFPTSIGIPPQMSIYAMGLHVGRNLTMKK